MTWALCLCRLDQPWHAVDELADHPGGLQAVCGHRWLPRPVLYDEPAGPLCQECADLQLERAVTACDGDQISGRPPGEPAPDNPLPAASRVRRCLIMAKHRLARFTGAWRTPRHRRLIDMVDMRSLVTHLMRPDAAAGRGPGGRFIAVCGTEVIPAARGEPGRDRCPECRDAQAVAE